MVQPHVDETIAHQGTDLYAAKAGEVFECSPEGILLKDGKPVELDEKFAEVCSKAVEGAPNRVTVRLRGMGPEPMGTILRFASVPLRKMGTVFAWVLVGLPVR